MKLTIVIPTYSDGPHGWCDMAATNARVWKDHCDELIITEDGTYCQQLHDLADLYILHPRLWVPENMNLGWKTALGRGADFVIMMDSDVEYVSGDLHDLCVPGKVAVPRIVQHPESISVAPMLSVPREVALERGYYNNGGGKYNLYHFDADYQSRILDLLTGVKTVKISHVGGATTKSILERPCGHEH